MRGRSRDVSTAFWRSAAIQPVSAEAKLVALWCMTGPDSTMPGIFKLSFDNVSEETGLKIRKIRRAFDELARAQDHDGEPFLQFDVKTRVVWITKRIEWEFPNRKLSPSQMDSVRESIEAVTPCPVVVSCCERYAGYTTVEDGETVAAFEALRDRVSHRVSGTLSGRVSDRARSVSRLQSPVPRLPSPVSREKRGRVSGTVPVERAAETGRGSTTEPMTVGNDGALVSVKQEVAQQAERAVLDAITAETGVAWKVGKAYGRNLRARIAEGVTVEECLAVLRFKSSKWRSDDKMRDCLTPETLFRPTNFERYREEARANGGRIAGRASSVDVASRLYAAASRLDTADAGELPDAQPAHGRGARSGTDGGGTGEVPGA